MHENIDALDGFSDRWLGQARQYHLVTGDIFQAVRAFKEEMMVIRCVGIEIATLWIDNDLSQQTRRRKLMKRIVDGREGNPNGGILRLGMQALGGHMPVPPFEQQLRQRNPLARWPQPRVAEFFDNVAIGSGVHDGFHINRLHIK